MRCAFARRKSPARTESAAATAFEVIDHTTTGRTDLVHALADPLADAPVLAAGEHSLDVLVGVQDVTDGRVAGRQHRLRERIVRRISEKKYPRKEGLKIAHLEGLPAAHRDVVVVPGERHQAAVLPQRIGERRCGLREGGSADSIYIEDGAL